MCRAEQQEAERRQREERQRHLEHMRAVKRTQDEAQASLLMRLLLKVLYMLRD